MGIDVATAKIPGKLGGKFSVSTICSIAKPNQRYGKLGEINPENKQRIQWLPLLAAALHACVVPTRSVFWLPAMNR
jgi:hypothetical protein